MSISGKKLVSLILVWILTISLLPVTASAQENGDAPPSIVGVWETDFVFPSSTVGVDTNDLVFRCWLEFREDGTVGTFYMPIDLSALRLFYHEFFVTVYYTCAYAAGYRSFEEVEQNCIDTTGLCVSDYMFLFMDNYDMYSIFTPKPAEGAYALNEDHTLLRLDLILMGAPSDPFLANSVVIAQDNMLLCPISYGDDKPTLYFRRVEESEEAPEDTQPPQEPTEPATEPTAEATEPEETVPVTSQPPMMGPAADGSAREIIRDVQILVDGVDEIGTLHDDDHTTKQVIQSGQSLRILSRYPFSALYLEWDDIPGSFTLSWEGGSMTAGREGFLHDYIQLPDAVTDLSFTFDTQPDKTLCNVAVYTAGRVPEGVQDWKTPCDKADILVFPTHSDDDVYFFGPMIAYYAIERQLTVQTAFMVDHNDVTRRHERLDGLWELGVRHYPILGDAPDLGIGALNAGLYYYRNNDIYGWQIEQIRRFQPLVVVGHDLDGEYGNAGHKVNAHYLTMSVPDAADPSKHPASAQKYGTWNTPKLYLHLYELNNWKLDVNTPMRGDPEGRTPIQVADAALDCHVTQGGVGGSVSQSDFNKVWDCRPFGLYRSLVGYDTRADVMDNIRPGQWR